MAPSTKIRVMISSRCKDPIALEGQSVTFTELRRKLKETVENEKLFGKDIFECWINEDAPPAEGTEDSWEHCLTQAKTADIMLVLYNGNAGWAKTGGDIGICHAEMQTAQASGAAKVRVIEVSPIFVPKKTDSSGDRHKRFQQYVTRQSPFWASAETGDAVLTHATAALRDAVVDMVRLGVREARKSKFDTGDALDWSRLDYSARKSAIEGVIRDSLLVRGTEGTNNSVYVAVNGKHILFCYHAVPAGMGVAAARELVGRPFLKDHALSEVLDGKRSGPVHVIACHKTVSEKQAVDLLGFPDATIVVTSFGVYVADNVQKIQLVFLENCRDETSTRHAVQRFFDWLERSGEADYLVDRASARRNIVKAIAKEYEP